MPSPEELDSTFYNKEATLMLLTDKQVLQLARKYQDSLGDPSFITALDSVAGAIGKEGTSQMLATAMDKLRDRDPNQFGKIVDEVLAMAKDNITTKTAPTPEK